MAQQVKTFEQSLTKTLRLDYLLSLPADYGEQADKRWPLILFLHGAGERGDNILQVKKHGIPRVVEQRGDLPFITVSPQCPPRTSWLFHFDALDALLNEIIATHAVDVDRVYLTGLSMGGNGSWHFAAAWPERFAAVAPICGWGDWFAGFPDQACVLKNVPIWAFHGVKDDIVPLAGSQTLVDALRRCNGDVRFTVYPDADHDSWTVTYDNPELYEWFLSKKRRA
jgi:predicted peptidase